MQNLLEGYRWDPDRDDVFHMMGYPDAASASESVREVVGAQVHRVARLVEPWGACREIQVERVGGDSVRLASGQTLTGRRVASMFRRARSVAVCLVTVGAAATAEVRRLMATGCMVEAMAVDAAASASAHASMGVLRARVCADASQRRCTTTVQYGPGYSGWEIGDMAAVFSCLATAGVPVRLNDELMMVPEKSLLGIIGIVPGQRRPAREVEPCRMCDLDPCSLRRAPYGGSPRC